MKRFRNDKPLYDLDHVGQLSKVDGVMIQSTNKVISWTPLGKRASSEVDAIINREYKKQSVASGKMTKLDASAANDLDSLTVAKVRKQQIRNYQNPPRLYKGQNRNAGMPSTRFSLELMMLSDFWGFAGLQIR